MLRITAAGILIAALLSPSPANAAPAQTEPPGPVLIEVVSATGSGCPVNTTDLVVSPNFDAFTVLYDVYAAKVGQGSKPTDGRKNCQLALRVHAPQGYSYALTQVDHHGRAALAAGANAVQKTSTYFAGQPQTAMATHSFTGPLDGAWHTTDIADIANLNYSVCGENRYLTVNTELRVNVGTSNPATTSSTLMMDSTESDIYHFAWKKCE